MIPKRARMRSAEFWKLGRHPERGSYEFATVAAIFDEAPICHVGFVNDEGQPVALPTIHARIGETLYFHGSVLARWLKRLDGAKVCVSATLVDAIVLARSAFQSSMNYRSAVAFGTASVVHDEAQRAAAFEAIVEHVCPGRWSDVRLPNEGELRATLVVGMSLERASAKIRSGPPIDSEGDLDTEYWAGLLPLRFARGEPVPAPNLRAGVEVPPYLLKPGE